MKLHELKNSNACKRHRAFPYKGKTEVHDYVKKSGQQIKACKDLIFGKPEADVQAEFNKSFEDLYYPTEITRDGERILAWKEVKRYTTAELNFPHKITRLKPMPVDIGVGEDVVVEPDFVVVGEPYVDNINHISYDGTLEIVKIHSGKNYSKKGLTLTKYAMIKYGRLFVSAGKTVAISAVDVYLKRADDAGEMAAKPSFINDFWAQGGNNVSTYTETYVGGKPTTITDKTITDDVKRFFEGCDSEECSEADCKTCNLYDVCNYAEPPIRMNKVSLQKQIGDLTLTTAQEDAIEYEKGIVRINAGAGVGKTVVVALRAVTLLNKGVRPEEILLITFTNAGAEEMRSRITFYNDDIGTGEDISNMRICTFNSFGDDILKEEYAQFGFSEPPKVIDEVERASIISSLLKKKIVNGLNYKQFLENTKYTKGAVWVAAKVFDVVKKGPYTIDDLSTVWCEIGDYRRFSTRGAVEDLIQLYDDYDAELRNNNLIEYADQEMMLFELLQKDPYYLEKFGFKHIIVDEFQDTNMKQMELLKTMINAPTCESLMVVGDDSQAIFSFRDTSPEYIINFSDYIGEKTDDIYLLENHRCTPEIIDFANKINAINVNKVSKSLISTRPSGAPVVTKGFHSKEDEQKYIVEGIKDHLSKGVKQEDIAIICATKSELREFAGLLTKEGIESVMLNPEPLLENSRVKAAIAFTKCLNCDGDEQNLMVYANAKAGGLLNKSAKEIEDLINGAKIDAAFIEAQLPDKKKEALLDIFKSLDHNDDEIYQQFLDTISRKTYDKILDYCSDFLIFGAKNEARRDHDYPGVVLTTCHSSKGLEWPIVYASISKFDTEQKNLHSGSSHSMLAMEETRRLLFVTATRARDELYVTGKYVAYGKKGEYVYNEFLKNALDCNGEPFNISKIRQEAEAIALEKKKKRAEERRILAEKMKKLSEEIPA